MNGMMTVCGGVLGILSMLASLSRRLFQQRMPRRLSRLTGCAEPVMRFANFLGLLFLGLMAASNVAVAGGGGGFAGATEYTQLLNNIQLADGYAQDALRYQNEILRYEIMLKNLADNPLGVTGPNLQLLVDNQAKIMSYGSAIGQSMSQVDKNVAKAFNNPNASTFGVKFGVAANMALDQLRTAMLDHGLQHDNAKTDADNIKKLVDKVQKSDGDKGAIQALGELNAAQLQEAQQYRQLFSEQSQAVNMAMGASLVAKENEKVAADAAQRAATVNVVVPVMSAKPTTYKPNGFYTPQ